MYYCVLQAEVGDVSVPSLRTLLNLLDEMKINARLTQNKVSEGHIDMKVKVSEGQIDYQIVDCPHLLY